MHLIPLSLSRLNLPPTHCLSALSADMNHIIGWLILIQLLYLQWAFHFNTCTYIHKVEEMVHIIYLSTLYMILIHILNLYGLLSSTFFQVQPISAPSPVHAFSSGLHGRNHFYYLLPQYRDLQLSKTTNRYRVTTFIFLCRNHYSMEINRCVAWWIIS